MSEQPPDSKVQKVEKPGKRGKKKGSPKTGGRVKWTPNKNSFSVRLALDNQNFNMIDEVIDLYGQLQDVEKKMSFLRWLAEFVYPRRSEAEAEPTKDPLDSLKSTSRPSLSRSELLSIVKKDA